MNKQELIVRIKRLDEPYLKSGLILELIEQLDEPQKPVVPQFVADWIEYAKFEDYHLLGAMDSIAISGRKNLDEWFRSDDDNMEIFARAWLDGYEVEKEKRYLVKMKNIHSYSSILKRDDITKEYFFGSEVQMCASSSTHTRKELEEAGFSEVFNSPLFEVEEVEG